MVLRRISVFGITLLFLLFFFLFPLQAFASENSSSTEITETIITAPEKEATEETLSSDKLDTSSNINLSPNTSNINGNSQQTTDNSVSEEEVQDSSLIKSDTNLSASLPNASSENSTADKTKSTKTLSLISDTAEKDIQSVESSSLSNTVFKYNEDDPVESYIANLYIKVLGRAPDEDGFTHWCNLMRSSYGVAEITQSFFSSKEYQNIIRTKEEIVGLIYEIMLNRTPDEPGLSEWTQSLNQGVSDNYVLVSVSNSSEFVDRCKFLNVNKGSIHVSQARDVNINMSRSTL